MVRKEASQQWGLAGANGQFCHPSTALPRKGKKGDSGSVVEIGGSSSLGVQQEASYELLLNLLPNLPADAERRPLKPRNLQRRRRARRAASSSGVPVVR
jgi:hypothetical protein